MPISKMVSSEVTSAVIKRIQVLEERLSKDGYRSYDPYDGLTSPIVRLFSSNHNLCRYWQQFIKISPFNLRPWVGIHRQIHTKTISDCASAYSLLGKIDPRKAYKKFTDDQLKILWSMRLPAKWGAGWGFRFPVSTRFIHADSTAGNIFTTINAIHAFLDGFDLTGFDQYLEYAHQGFLYAEHEMGYRKNDEYIVWTYWKGLEEGVYNVNGLMLGLLGRQYAYTGEARYRDWCYQLYRYIQMGQNQDGSWFYTGDSRGRWVDGFHTGYVLEGICRAVLAGVLQPDDTLKRGVSFFLEHLFTLDSLPKYYSDNIFPLDIQNCAQALQTLVFLSRIGLCETQRVLDTFHSIERGLWNKKGQYYNYQRTRWWTNHIPMHRWGTAPMLLALANVWSSL